MIKRAILLISLIFLIMSNASKYCFVQAQMKVSDVGAIVVKIKDTTKAAIDVGVITVVNTETKEKSRFAITSEEGCKLVNLRANKYILIAWCPGFEPEVITVDYNGENKKEVNFILNPGDCGDSESTRMPIMSGCKDPTLQALEDSRYFDGNDNDIAEHINKVLRWSSKNGHIDYVKALVSIGAKE